MATPNPGQVEHNQTLERLCRICAGFLTKFNDPYDTSHSCTEKMEFLTQNYGINVEKDDPEIHPARFCHLCYLSLTRIQRPVFWHIHTESGCVTCSFIEKKKKGGRSKKLKRGKKNFKSMEETGQTEKTLPHIQDTAHTVTRKVEELEMESPLTYRIEEDQKFQFIHEIKEDFKCPICKDILFRPLETVCEHYFCGECFKQALQSYGFPLDCPVCRIELNSADHIKSLHEWYSGS